MSAINNIKVAENRFIGKGNPCFIIAEAGINHNGDMELAKKMIDSAKECGADAIKFQTFKAEEFISDKSQTYTYKSQGVEVTESMYEMFKRYEFTKEQWVEIAKYCSEKGIVFFSTPQNPSDLDFLLSIVDMPVIKVGSDDLTNLGLMKYYASKGKPLIISAGMAFISEVEDAVNEIRKQGKNDIAVLHCISSYPAEPGEVNLNKMLTLNRAFDIVTGFSDHTEGSTASVAAAALGASIIEKHITLDKNLPGPDHRFSSDMTEFAQLVNGVRAVEIMLGSFEVKPTEKEMGMRELARRSIVAAGDIDKGELLTEDNMIFKRPGTGLPPKFLKYFLGRKACSDIKKDELITFDKIG